MSQIEISVLFNGQTIDVPSGLSISELLQKTEIRSELVAVEVNREIVPRDDHASYIVVEGDEIEAVTLVGGG